MTKSLPEILNAQIEQCGPMDVGQYMSMALGHPEHGYYMKRDPFGVDGDFTTAPEISQMFGEMIGAWVLHSWIEMGRPSRLSVLECGPGRGTLMADVMRATAAVAEFHAACDIHFLEMSPVLKAKQGVALADYDPCWHDSLESVPRDEPLIVIGNEFLDALPVRQFMKVDEVWFERMVACEDGELCFKFVPSPVATSMLPEHILSPRVAAGASDIFEYSPASVSFVRTLCDLLKNSGGQALFIDYGSVKSGSGETLQAVYKHQYSPVLAHIGDADLTAHVDFEMLLGVIALEGVSFWGAVEQGEFLNTLGICERADFLKGKANDQQRKDIEIALHRLTHADEMGTLFKVIGFGDVHETA